MRFFQALFPSAAFIVVIRHPVSVAYATKTKRWTRSTKLEMLLENTLVAYERVLADVPLIRKFYLLRYEEFVQSPQAALDELFRFIGVGPFRLVESVKPDVNHRYVQMWKRAFLWRRFHQPLLARCEARIRPFGYSFAEPEELGASFVSSAERR